MASLNELKNLILYSTNQVFKTIEQIIEKVPENQLDFKPTEKSKSFGNLSVHLYNMCYLYFAGPVFGKFSHEDFQNLFCDPRKVSSKAEILLYAQKVKNKITRSLGLLNKEVLDQEITFDFTSAPKDHFTNGWGTWVIKGSVCLFSILEESIDHRAQLNLYLRIMGEEPVFVYRSI